MVSRPAELRAISEPSTVISPPLSASITKTPEVLFELLSAMVERLIAIFPRSFALAAEPSSLPMLEDSVLSFIVIVPSSLTTPPPCSASLLDIRLRFMSVSPMLKTAPPSSVLKLPLFVKLVSLTVAFPVTNSPPP